MAKTRRGNLFEFYRMADEASRQNTGRGISSHIAEALKNIADQFYTQANAPGRASREEPMEDDLKNAYYVLGVMPTAPDEVVKAAYRSLSHKYHPDKGKVPDGTMMKGINQAWALIRKQRDI